MFEVPLEPIIMNDRREKGKLKENLKGKSEYNMDNYPALQLFLTVASISIRRHKSYNPLLPDSIDKSTLLMTI